MPYSGINESNGPKTAEFLQSQESSLLKRFKNSVLNEESFSNRVDRVDHSRIKDGCKESGGMGSLFDKAFDKV